MSKPVNNIRSIDMSNYMSLDARCEFDTRRIKLLEEVCNLMAKGVGHIPDDKFSIVNDLATTANTIDELWKQEYKNSNSRNDILMKIIESNYRDYDKLDQQKTLLEQEKLLLEKRIKELEANVASSSSSNNLEEKKHDYPKAFPSTSMYSDAGSSTFRPRITEEKLKEVFKHWNYYSREQFMSLVGEQVVKWYRRSIPQLLDSKSANDARLQKAKNDLALIWKNVPKWLVIKFAITELTKSKEAIELSNQRAAIDRATLKLKQEKEQRDQRRKLEKTKRMHEDLRDSMFGMRSKKPAIDPVHVHFQEPIADEYDYSDGFVVKDHESEHGEESWNEATDKTSSDDDIAALSDAVDGLDVGEATGKSG